MKTRKEIRKVDGKFVVVSICPPGRVRKGLSLTKAKYQTINSGGRAVAKERGLIIVKDQ